MQHPIHRASLRPRATFRDDARQQEFANRGYVIVPLLSANNLAALSDLYRSLSSGIDAGFYSSMFSGDFDYRDRASEGVEAVLLPAVTDLLSDYRALAGGFMVKIPGPQSELAAHQDWNIVDEQRFTSINVWAPVTPLTGENGSLYVLPGSHRFIDGLRPSLFYPSSLDPHRDVVRQKYLHPVEVPPGHAVIHNSALVHASSANQSDEARVVSSLNMIPREAPPIHYHLDQATGDIEFFEVDDRFYLRHLLGARPDYPVKDTIPKYQAPVLSAEELQRHCAEVGAARS